MKQHGLSLLELLISLALGATLSLAFTQLYLQSQQQQRYALAMVEVHENAQLALDILQYELRMAGFSKGATVQAYSASDCADEKSWLLDFSTGVDIQANTDHSIFGVPMATSCLRIPFVEHSDVLWIRRLASRPVIQAEDFNQAWYWLETHQPSESHFAYLESWPRADQLATIKNLWPVHSRIYYVRGYSVRGDKIPSLVMVTPTRTGFQQQVLIEGVESMQLQWQVKEGEHWQLYRRANQEQLQAAVLARVYLLLRHRHPLKEKSSNTHYLLADSQAIRVDDQRYYRQVFSQSVMLRNHGAGNE